MSVLLTGKRQIFALLWMGFVLSGRVWGFPDCQSLLEKAFALEAQSQANDLQNILEQMESVSRNIDIRSRRIQNYEQRLEQIRQKMGVLGSVFPCCANIDPATRRQYYALKNLISRHQNRLNGNQQQLHGMKRRFVAAFSTAIEPWIASIRGRFSLHAHRWREWLGELNEIKERLRLAEINRQRMFKEGLNGPTLRNAYNHAAFRGNLRVARELALDLSRRIAKFANELESQFPNDTDVKMLGLILDVFSFYAVHPENLDVSTVAPFGRTLRLLTGAD